MWSRWRRDGREIVYLAPDNNYLYDVSADGQRFLVNTLVGETTSTALTLVINWTAGLKK